MKTGDPSFRNLMVGSVFNAHEDWDQGTQSFEVFCGLVADNAENALAALTDKDVDAAIERLGEAAFEYGKKISDYREVFPNGFRSEAFEAAERDLRAIIAMRGRGVVGRLPGQPLFSEAQIQAAVAEYGRVAGHHRVSTSAMQMALHAALAAKEQG